MRSLNTLLIAALVVSMGSMAFADLQEVTISGSERIRANSYDDDSFDSNAVEHRTRIGINADFSDDVRVFVEFDDYSVFGSDFRDSPWTNDSNTGGAGDISLYQSYIEVNGLWDTALRARLGRQEVTLGSEWLIGDNDASSGFTGLSFDGLRLDYGADNFTVTGLWLKLAEAGTGDWGDEDVDLYALYGSYSGIEDITIDAYWMMVRADGATGGAAALAGDYGADVDLHTIGARAGGNVGNFDFEAELAFQFGDVEFAGGDSDFDGIGFNGELGYTFDANYDPRIYLGFVFLEGPDSGDAGFNRLFSNWEYSEFLSNTDLSNVWILRGGISASPREDLSIGLDLAYFHVDEDASGSDDNLGFETNLHAEYQYSEDLVFRVGWAHFFAGEGIEDGNAINGSGASAGSSKQDSSYSSSVFPAGHGHAGLPSNVGFGSEDDFDYLYFETEISF
jgi:hypothetical protein